MANQSYQSEIISMAHCPFLMKSGKYDQVPGDSILGLYGQDFLNFEKTNVTADVQGYGENCSFPNYCELNSIANAYHGNYIPYGHPIVNLTYATVYMGIDSIYRQHPYEFAKQNGCEYVPSPNHQ